MKKKTSELKGRTLDFAVAQLIHGKVFNCRIPTEFEQFKRRKSGVALEDCPYSSSWALAGPLIEWERVELTDNGPPKDEDSWVGHICQTKSMGSGPTPLIAAMRCYVASKLGDEVYIPDELCNG